MIIKGEREYIVVNNSGKIEVVNRNLESVATISGLISPRYMVFIGDNKAYVTSMYSDSVAVLNTLDNSISGYINLRRTSEGIVKIGTKAYVANWVGGNEIMVINTLTDQVIDSIQVGFEPESIVKDKNETLWVLCNGGWMREHFAELISINTNTDEIDRRFIFPSISDSPVSLLTDGTGENLFYLDKGVRKMPVTATSLPASALIPESGRYFYKAGINPVNGDIFVTDAADYQQKGNVMRYTSEGNLVSDLKADIIPAFLCFRLNSDFSAK
jgi:YVTN family beta-propeller protein